MVLAAGLGTRMRPITDTLPKPLVRVRGRALIDHAIDRLEAARIARIVVNTHYKGEQIAAHLAARKGPPITISAESDLRETGGGVVQALPFLGERFFVVNSDILWLDGKVPALERLGRAWREEDADALLLLQRTTTAFGYDGPGDYLLDPLGVPRRRREREIAPYLFAGVQILHRRLFADAAALPRKFSLTRLYDVAQEAGRLRAIVHDGEWFHIGTPAGLRLAEERLAVSRIER
ncbi:MAG: nucleotidyltransferase family protein [Alphaproteobacteria bacterium]|nr:nucleotidyltransferase family protein [Alphaproteobacteria bacterium]